MAGNPGKPANHGRLAGTVAYTSEKFLHTSSVSDWSRPASRWLVDDLREFEKKERSKDEKWALAEIASELQRDVDAYFVTEAHFYCDTAGKAYPLTESRGYSFWRKHLEVFDTVTVIGRAFPTERTSGVTLQGPGVSFYPIPGYIGPARFLLKYKRIRQRLATLASVPGTFIVRLPSLLGSLMVDELRSRTRPYGAQVVGDPFDVFAPGAVQHPLRPFFRWWFSRRMGVETTSAAATAYVTQGVLQQRYPPAARAYSTYYSDVEIGPQDIVATPRLYRDSEIKRTLVSVGMMNQLYKAPDILLRAMSLCLKEGLDLELVLIGDGRFRSRLEALARELGIAARVKFLGMLRTSEAVRLELDRSDLFVLPSLTEGLPRAMIEAMARGVPCIGSTAGGIPELLVPEDLVPPGNADVLASKIVEVIRNPLRMTEMSVRNLNMAANFEESKMRERRLEFLQYLKQLST